MAEEESSSEREAVIVIVGNCSVLLSESVASVEAAAKEAFENKMNPLYKLIREIGNKSDEAF